MEGVDRLRALYNEIHRWASQHDPDQVPRRVVPEALDSEIVLIGSALARDTQRLSGLPYTHPDGRLSRGGRVLDDFLSRFGHSIDPSTNRRYAYSTDLLPRFPGRESSGMGNVEPSSSEIAECAHWLEAELQITAPKVVLLLGVIAARGFLGRSAGVTVGRLEDVAGQRHDCFIAGREMAVFPVYQPSWAWQRPAKSSAAFATVSAQVRALLAR